METVDCVAQRIALALVGGLVLCHAGYQILRAVKYYGGGYHRLALLRTRCKRGRIAAEIATVVSRARIQLEAILQGLQGFVALGPLPQLNPSVTLWADCHDPVGSIVHCPSLWELDRQAEFFV